MAKKVGQVQYVVNAWQDSPSTVFIVTTSDSDPLFPGPPGTGDCVKLEHQANDTVTYVWQGTITAQITTHLYVANLTCTQGETELEKVTTAPSVPFRVLLETTITVDGQGSPLPYLLVVVVAVES